MNQNYWHLLNFSEYQDFDFGISMIDSWIESSSANVKPQSKIFVDEIKTAVTQKYEFEFRDNSLWSALCGNLGPCGLWCKEQNLRFFNRILCHNLKAFDWELDWKNQAVSYEEIKTSKIVPFLQWHFYRLPVHHILTQGTQPMVLNAIISYR